MESEDINYMSVRRSSLRGVTGWRGSPTSMRGEMGMVIATGAMEGGEEAGEGQESHRGELRQPCAQFRTRPGHRADQDQVLSRLRFKQ